MKINPSAMLTLVVLFCCTALCAQQDNPLFEHQNLTVRGNSVLIGNTVLGINSKMSFSNPDILPNHLDFFYVDVDGDDSTFGSSTASFKLPETASKIKHAGLYWAGLNPSTRERRVQNILIKFNDGNYTQIDGEVFYDSRIVKSYLKESPYLCYADITTQLENQKKGRVDITLANILANTTYIKGGNAAGWLLYIVYEDATESLKQFTSYTGIKNIDAEQVVFKDVKPENLSNGATELLLATLGGDNSEIKGGVRSIYNYDNEAYRPLYLKRLFAQTFYTSAMRNAQKPETSQTPNGIRTKGFDILKMHFPDTVITENTSDVFIQLGTKNDPFYTFFLAFETELDRISVMEPGNAKLMDITTTNAEIVNDKISFTVNSQSSYTNALPLMRNHPDALTGRYNTTPRDEDENTDVSSINKQSLKNKDQKIAKAIEPENEPNKENPQVKALNSVTSNPMVLIAEPEVKPLPTLQPLTITPSVTQSEKSDGVISSEIGEKEKLLENVVAKDAQANAASPTNLTPVEKITNPEDKALPVSESVAETSPTTINKETEVTISEETAENETITAIKTTPEEIEKTNIKSTPVKTTQEQALIAKADVAVEENDEMVKKEKKSTQALDPLTRRKVSVFELLNTKAPSVINEKIDQEMEIERIKRSKALIAINEEIEEVEEEIKEIKEEEVTPSITVKDTPEMAIPKPIETKAPSLTKDKMKYKMEMGRIKRSKSIIAKNVEPGYYLIAKIFSNKSLAELWMRKLNRDDFNVQIISSSQDRMFYISIENSMNIEELLDRLQTVILESEMEKTWVYKFNL